MSRRPSRLSRALSSSPEAPSSATNAPTVSKKRLSESSNALGQPQKRQRQNPLHDPFSERGPDRTHDSRSKPNDSDRQYTSPGTLSRYQNPQRHERASEHREEITKTTESSVTFSSLVNDHTLLTQDIEAKTRTSDLADQQFQKSIKEGNRCQDFSPNFSKLVELKNRASRNARELHKKVDSGLKTQKAEHGKQVVRLHSLHSRNDAESAIGASNQNTKQKEQLESQQKQIGSLQDQFNRLALELNQSKQGLHESFEKDLGKLRDKVNDVESLHKSTDAAQRALCLRTTELESEIKDEKTRVNQRLNSLESEASSMAEKHVEQNKDLEKCVEEKFSTVGRL